MLFMGQAETPHKYSTTNLCSSPIMVASTRHLFAHLRLLAARWFGGCGFNVQDLSRCCPWHPGHCWHWRACCKPRRIHCSKCCHRLLLIHLSSFCRFLVPYFWNIGSPSLSKLSAKHLTRSMLFSQPPWLVMNLEELSNESEGEIRGNPKALQIAKKLEISHHIHLRKLTWIAKIAILSMVVSGSPKKWQVPHNHPIGSLKKKNIYIYII